MCIKTFLVLTDRPRVRTGTREESRHAVLARCLVPHQHPETSVTPWDGEDQHYPLSVHRVNEAGSFCSTRNTEFAPELVTLPGVLSPRPSLEPLDSSPT